MKNTLLAIIATTSLFTTACSKPSSEQMKTMRERVHQADETNDQIKNLLREAWINRILGIDYAESVVDLFDEAMEKARKYCIESKKYDDCIKTTDHIEAYHNILKEALKPYKVLQEWTE